MKRLLLLLTCISLWTNSLAAPNVLITGNFSMVEPLTNQEYVLTEYDMPANATNLTVNWTFTGHNTSSTIVWENRSTSPLMTRWKAKNVQWANTPNGANQHMVQATLTYTINNGSTVYTLTAPALQVQVKHIGSISTMNIAGTNYNNNNYRNHACGTSPVTVSVPAVATDPSQTVNYTWTFPSGWSPASTTTTTPSVSVTPSAGGQGIIKVEAKRIDGTTKVAIQVNITRPLPTQPTINSADLLLCNPVTITATASSATSYEWVTTGGISASSPGGTNSAYITGTSDGTVKVRSYSSVCAAYSAYSFALNVKRSAPIPAAIQVTTNGGGSPDFMCNGSGVDLNVWTGEPGSVWGAWAVSDPANTYFNYSGPTAYFNSYVNNCYGITVNVSNCFGSVQKGITICVDYCGARVATSHTVFPNPAREVVNIEFDNVDDFSTLPSTILLVSEKSGKQVKSVNALKQYANFKENKKLAIDVSDVPRGTYYLHMGRPNGETTKTRLILN